MKFKSITNSTYVDEGMEALRFAKEYKNKKDLKENFEVNKFSKSARNNCWTQINKRYLSRKDGSLNEPLIKLIDYEDYKVNKELMFYHYVQREPIFKKTLLDFIYPRLKTNDKFIVESDNVLFFISDYLDYADSTIKKTARSIVKALVDFEIAEVEGNEVKVKNYRPELLSVVFA
ncbi:MAG: BrxA family protein, partial [Candidatus Woesearchaeota archaeon]